MCKFCEDKQYTIRITVDKWNEEKKQFETDNNFEVKYCPMCGSKLLEYKDNKADEIKKNIESWENERKEAIKEGNIVKATACQILADNLKKYLKEYENEQS